VDAKVDITVFFFGYGEHQWGIQHRCFGRTTVDTHNTTASCEDVRVGDSSVTTALLRVAEKWFYKYNYFSMNKMNNEHIVLICERPSPSCPCLPLSHNALRNPSIQKLCSRILPDSS
jgi:hypothetical protein